VNLDELHQQLRKSISEAQVHYQASANSKWTPPLDCKIGDKAFVKAEFIWMTRPSKKLSEKFLGPYEIILQVGSLSFTLCLPDSMCSIHPVFHVVMLEPETPNTILNQIQPPPPSGGHRQ
jgi:hypothetical protein